MLNKFALFLPKGSIRALMALGATGVTGALLLTDAKIPTEWWMAFSAIITFYFGSGTLSDTANAINGSKNK